MISARLWSIIAKGGACMTTKFHKVAKAGIITAMALMPMLALAQLPVPTSPYAGQPITLLDIKDVIETIARFLILVSVIVNVIIGALVVLAVGLILQTLAGLVNWTVFFNA